MRISYIALATAFSLGACSPAPEQESSLANTNSNVEAQMPATQSEIQAETARLNEWFEQKYEEQLMLSPIQLTFLGRDERQGEIDDFSEKSVDDALARSRKNAKELEQNFDYDKLTDDAKVSYDVWMYQAEQAEAAD